MVECLCESLIPSPEKKEEDAIQSVLIYYSNDRTKYTNTRLILDRHDWYFVIVVPFK